jgi:iron complex outermembrane receptor protein
MGAAMRRYLRWPGEEGRAWRGADPRAGARLQKFGRALWAALSGCIVLVTTADTSAQVQSVQTSPHSLERVTITGSNVPRTDQETVAPVEVITREQIERSGAQTVADVLRTLPITGSGAFNERNDSSAQGSTSVSLRSLGQKATLVLVNGRRTAGYGFAQNLQDTFVDLSGIPKSAVERIEILKDGASAIYGSDAIAGVVNIILRNNFQGVEATANVGFFQDTKDYRASIAAGFGDPKLNGFNLFGVLDYYTSAGLVMADTEFGRTRDYRDRQGGRNFQYTVAGGTWLAFPYFRAHAECARPVDYAGASALGLFSLSHLNRPLGEDLNQPGNTFCVRDFANAITVTPDNERIGFSGRGTLDLGRDVRGHVELSISRNKTDFVSLEPGVFNVRFTPAPPPVNLATSFSNVIFAPGAAGNPLAENATYLGLMNDFGFGQTNVTSDALRLLAGLTYSIGRWDFDSAVSYSRSDVSEESRLLLTEGTIVAFGVSDAVQPPTPITTQSLYNLERPSSNSPALRASMFGSDIRTGKSELAFVDTRATTQVGNLPGGPIAVALGVEYRAESFQIVPSQLALSGGVLGPLVTLVDGSRTSVAMYGELALPVTRELEGQVALRYDRYSDFGTTVNPKLGLKYRPSSQYLLRTTWGSGFRAPSLPEITRSSSFFGTFIIEPTTGAPWNFPASMNANPDLKPEESHSFTAGIVFEPTPNFSAGLDFYRIDWTNLIAWENFQTLANDFNSPRVVRDPVTGTVITIAGTFINLTRVSTQGMDLDLRYQTGTPYGRVETRLAATYVMSYEIDGTEMAGSNGAAIVSNISAIPRWKARWTASWEREPWTVQAAVNYVHHYWRTYGLVTFPAFFRAPELPNEFPQTGQLDPKNPSYTTLDLYARYNVTPKFAVTGSVINVTNVEPPFDPSFSTGYFFDPSLGYDIRGRTLRLGAQYTF